MIKVIGGAGYLENELGTALTLDGTETVEVCDAAACAGGPTAPTAIVFDTNAWYISPATVGAKYIRISKTGYVRQVDANAITAAVNLCRAKFSA